MEPRSLPELLRARATGGLAGEEFFEGLTFADLAEPSQLPGWLAFLHDESRWEVVTPRGLALFEPLTVVIAARAVARALALHEQDVVVVDGDLTSPRLQVGGVAAALYAGATLRQEGEGTVRVTDVEAVVEAETARRFIGGPETLGVGGFAGPDARLELCERLEADVADGELLLRGPLVMAGYADDPAGTAAAFAGGWLHTGLPARCGDGFEGVFIAC